MFDTAAKGEAFVVHDVNNDGSTWAWSEADKAFKTQFNRRNAMDDWLVTPPLKLQKGKMYMFTAKMRTYLGNPLNVEIRCGRGDTPDAMTEVLMAPQQIKNRDSKDYSFYLLPDADGIYHVGIHEVTPADNSWFLFVDGVSVSAGAEAVIPDVVTEFSVTPDFNGGKTAVVSFKAPEVAVNGSELAKLTRIDVLRNGVVIKTFPEPGIGAPLDFTDEVPEIGYYQYDVVPFNEAGQGKKTGTTVFVGPNEPARPAWVKIAETENPGEVTLTWERVTTDKDGNSMNPDLVTYTIIAAGDGEEPVLVAENIKGTSHTFQALEAGVEQSFVGYGLRAQTEGGYSLMAVTDLIPVGTPYAAPWSESFAGGEAQSLFRSDNREAMWNIYTDNAGIPSCDGDGGMAAMFGEFSGADATLYSGKISLDGLENPVLMFYTYNIYDDTEGDQNELEVAVNGGNGFEVEKTVLTWTLGAEEGWYLVVVPLEEYK
ncbi:MAG: choice-of-anchor J domain-containing protein, partial [Muribaculaceae bacterium]|nr:choice-of-anchor J domain-containing protein [Muribaculaceae bacterium]